MRLASKLTGCEAWGGSLSTRWAGFAGKHPAVPVQPVLRSRHHRFPICTHRAAAPGPADCLDTRQTRGASLRENRRPEPDPREHQAAGFGTRGRTAQPPGRARDGRDALLAPVHRRGDPPDGAVRSQRPGAAAAYPQYSKTTTGSSLNEWARCFHPNGWSPRVHVIERFHEDGAYLGSLVETVSRSMAGFGDPGDVDVIFSAHSVPLSVVENGDPYQQEIERTVELVWQRGGWPARRHLCYQSKVGASKWLSPSMHETVRRLAAEKRKHLLVVPISFVSDHVETLHEIDIAHREQALSLGIEDYRMTQGLNDSAAFIQALAGLVRRKVSITSAGRSAG